MNNLLNKITSKMKYSVLQIGSNSSMAIILQAYATLDTHTYTHIHTDGKDYQTSLKSVDVDAITKKILFAC